MEGKEWGGLEKGNGVWLRGLMKERNSRLLLPAGIIRLMDYGTSAIAEVRTESEEHNEQ